MRDRVVASRVTITVEPMAPGTAAEVVELVGVGAEGLRTVAAPVDTDAVRFVRSAKVGEAEASMSIVVGEAAEVVRLRSRLCVSVRTTASMASGFDAVLRAESLEQGLAAFTGLVTADVVMLPIAELHAFLAGAGRLRMGSAEGPSVGEATRLALRSLHQAGGSTLGRLLVQVEAGDRTFGTELGDLRAELARVAMAERVGVAVRRVEGEARRVSVVMAERRGEAGEG